MPQQFKNNAKTKFNATLELGGTTLYVTPGDGSLFPVTSVEDYFIITLESTLGFFEIVRVTERVGDTFTIIRAQEGTVPHKFILDDTIELRLTVAFIDALKPGSFGIRIDNGENVITTGIKAYYEVPFRCTLTGITALADQIGNAVVDIWKSTYVNYPPTIADTITSLTPITIISQNKYKDSVLDNWDINLFQGDILVFNVVSIDVIQNLSIVLNFLRT